MVCVAQRVLEAAVAAGPETVSRIGPGLLLLVGVAEGDTPAAAESLAERVAKLRVFADPSGRMGLCLADAGGEALAVSQFTLLADFSKGNRPSFHRAAPPASARPLGGAPTASRKSATTSPSARPCCARRVPFSRRPVSTRSKRPPCRFRRGSNRI